MSHAYLQVSLGVIARIGAVASSAASAPDRMAEILDQLGRVIPIAGSMVSVVDPVANRRSTLITAGYSHATEEYLNSEDFHQEMIAPYSLPRLGAPVRLRDLPVDPMSLRCVTEHWQPAGLLEGALSALITSDNRYVGFIDVSTGDQAHPSDEAITVIEHLVPILAHVVDPLQSARRLVSSLTTDCLAVALGSDGEVIPLQGDLKDGMLEPRSDLYPAVTRHLGDKLSSTAFLWPATDGGWYACRAYRCRDYIVVLAPRAVTHELTQRELEILTLLVDGSSNDDIANRLWISPRTVRAHVEHVLAKLNVPTRAAAASRAMESGLLLSPEVIGYVRSRRR
ncbi:helix-turn-helix transcriptional regulator [Rhodococcus rhodochrous]|uniref:helix-turn-helix transcriptional regulator n=1 Tax=Rhodococcus rhodochrous TaxID=1829 RepID=UPI00178419CF|nr:LuxR C-terminal-related transcriptional regulator [Rhodococcus rhodochrous]